MTREEKQNGIKSAIKDMCWCGECDECEFFDPEDRTDGEHWCAVRDNEGRVPYKSKWDMESAIGEIHNNGWILCSEQMPEEHESMFAKLKGTDNWCKGMFEKASDMVLVTLIDEEGNAITTYAHTMDGKWSCSLLKLNLYKVIAWQPFPEPYKECEQ